MAFVNAAPGWGLSKACRTGTVRMCAASPSSSSSSTSTYVRAWDKSQLDVEAILSEVNKTCLFSVFGDGGLEERGMEKGKKVSPKVPLRDLWTRIPVLEDRNLSLSRSIQNLLLRLHPTRIDNDQVAFDAKGLVPAIAQQHDSGEVLMMAWMNADSIRETLTHNRAVYYSRSRGKLWRKGESSGQTQELVDFRLDCDGDTVLLRVDQLGVACHTGRLSCFYRAPRDTGTLETISDVLIDPKELYASAS